MAALILFLFGLLFLFVFWPIGLVLIALSVLVMLLKIVGGAAKAGRRIGGDR